mgnify:CR=1 FL=1
MLADATAVAKAAEVISYTGPSPDLDALLPALAHGGIDFIDLQWFPIFNVADISVNVGGAIFIIWSLFAGRGTPVWLRAIPYQVPPEFAEA